MCLEGPHLPSYVTYSPQFKSQPSCKSSLVLLLSPPLAAAWLLFSMSALLCLALLALSSLTAASDLDCDELVKPSLNQSKVLPSDDERLHSLFILSYNEVNVSKAADQHRWTTEFLCISVKSRYPADGYSRLGFQTLKSKWNSSNQWTAPGWKSKRPPKVKA